MILRSTPIAEPDAPGIVNALIARAIASRASDMHIDPAANEWAVRFRLDGLLETVAMHPPEVGRMLVVRLMVMSKLLTYRPDVPQEGRAAFVQENPAENTGPVELRISIMPTAHGPRAAVRLPADLLQPQSLNQLDLPASAVAGIEKFTRADSGMLIVTGPAGSGKTTTIYAILRHIAQASAKSMSIVTLEDPIERDLSRDGIVQIEVTPFGQLTYEKALRSILRQDPQVLMLGEIRDAATASIAVQAALSGHRLICTLHAAAPAGALVRLLEMGLEPYQLTSAIFGILTQRLLRRQSERDAGKFQGRLPVAEFVEMDTALRAALLARADESTLRTTYSTQAGYQSLSQVAGALAARGITTVNEIERVLGNS